MKNKMGVVMVATDWDDIIADKVASRVLDKIGDQLKMPAAMTEALAHVFSSWESTMVFPGIGPNGITAWVTYRNDSIRISFESLSGERLMERTFHA